MPTIHGLSGKSWPDAKIVGVGKDTFRNERDVLIVEHPHFNQPVEFYAEADAEGRHYNVGNSAFWLTEE